MNRTRPGGHDCAICGCEAITGATDLVLVDVGRERERQDARFPGQTLPDSPVRGVGVGEHETSVLLMDAQARERRAKERVRYHLSRGVLTWADVLDEEVAEAYAATEAEHLREELVQVAAVAVRWIEDLDRKAAR